ncbi:MAG: hypothetical protein R6V55_03085 [Desulfovermiculus sp.]
MKRRYNYIYAKLVEGEDDVLGLLAYGLYKRDKIEHIKRINAETGEDPTEEELEHFHKSSEAHIENYETRALNLSRNFLESVLGERVAEIEQEYKEKFLNEAKGLKTKWWPAIMQSFLGLVFALAFGKRLRLAGISLQPQPIMK